MTSMEIAPITTKSTEKLQARHTSKSKQLTIQQRLMTHDKLRNRTLVMLGTHKTMHKNRRHASQFHATGIFGHCVRCECPFPAAVGDLLRWVKNELVKRTQSRTLPP